MRVSREKAEANRAALLDAASRLFRERGIEGVGVADIARAAGLTHGALYAHFPSKGALAAEAFSHGFAGNMAASRVWMAETNAGFEDILDGLLSTSMRDRLATGCPMTASASEIARQGPEASTSFARAFLEQAGVLEDTLEDTIGPTRKRRLAMAALAAEIGAVAVSRAVHKADPTLADEVLHYVRDLLRPMRRTAPPPCAPAAPTR
jgi:TetR/AcrR family transcriptional regulator, transcriptional repressor for nem operon